MALTFSSGLLFVFFLTGSFTTSGTSLFRWVLIAYSLSQGILFACRVKDSRFEGFALFSFSSGSCSSGSKLPGPRVKVSEFPVMDTYLAFSLPLGALGILLDKEVASSLCRISPGVSPFRKAISI